MLITYLEYRQEMHLSEKQKNTTSSEVEQFQINLRNKGKIDTL